MHPHLDLLDEIIRVVGWPTLFGALVWIVRKWDKGQREFREMSENTKIAVAGVKQVQEQVDTITVNHLAHLQTGISQVAASNDKAVEILESIDKGVAVLVDRDRRV